MDKKAFQTPDIKYHPDVRWWLAEGFHTDETLKKEISEIQEGGFGAVEFLAMDEPDADDALYGWGSEEWVHDSHVVIKEATDRHLGVSMTSGTNWANANLPNITPDDPAASKELDFTVETLNAGSSRTGSLPKTKLANPGITNQELVAVLAIRRSKEQPVRETGAAWQPVFLDRDTSVVLTDQAIDGTLTWTAPSDGTYLLFFFWLHGTGQTAEPSVGTSYTVNYIDRCGINALIKYWEETVLTEELRENLRRNGRAMMYMDSLELGTFGSGGQLWGYHFLEEFEKRRGYDLTPYLPFVLKQSGMMQPVFRYRYACSDTLFLEKLYNDLYQNMTDMYMDNMLKPMQEWLHTRSMSLRAEISYGLPFEISLPGKYVDGIETESLEFASQIDSYRGLAGAAHIYGHTFSSETGATILNYMMGLDFYTQIIYTQFAAGVTKTVLHGYSSIAGTEGTACWPGHEGMWPIFSERFGPRQPAFRHYKDWTSMIARYQMLLSEGHPRTDIGIIRLDYNFNNKIFDMIRGEEETYYASGGMRGNQAFYWKDMGLQNNGYTWDYFAPQILEEDFVDCDGHRLLPDGPAYKALIVYQQELPLSSAEKLLLLAKKGLPILFVNGMTEDIRPGVSKTHKAAASMTPFLDGQDERLLQIVAQIKALPNVWELGSPEDVVPALSKARILPEAGFTQANKNILTRVQEHNGEKIIFVYNMQYAQKEPFSFTLRICGSGKLYRADCWNGSVAACAQYDSESGFTFLPLTLMPGEAALYILDTAAAPAPISVSPRNAMPVTVPLTEWELEVEDWNEGTKKVLTEDRGLGIVTKEIYYETKKTMLHVGKTTLKPWKDIPAVGPEVSGVGYYSTSVFMPGNWDTSSDTFLYIGSTCGNTAAVYVNGVKAGAYDFNAHRISLGQHLKSGENRLTVEVSSTLNNRLIARDYYEKGIASSRALMKNANNANESDSEDSGTQPVDSLFRIRPFIRDYGMAGTVELQYQINV